MYDVTDIVLLSRGAFLWRAGTRGSGRRPEFQHALVLRFVNSANESALQNSVCLTRDADWVFGWSGTVSPPEAFPVRKQRMRQDIGDRMQPGEDKKDGPQTQADLPPSIGPWASSKVPLNQLLESGRSIRGCPMFRRKL